MKTKVKVRYANGEVKTMLIRGKAVVGDSVRSCGSDAVAVVIEVLY